MRIGIVALLHESNTFVRQRTSLDHFRQDLFLQGDTIREALVASHHEVGGFFSGLEACADVPVTAVPLAAFRATPSGTITDEAFAWLVAQTLECVEKAQPLDGLLVAAHGAAVTERHLDADGAWLAELRGAVGQQTPIIATLDAHANLSERMVASCDALIAYCTNPHLDQRERGHEAAELMISTLLEQSRPTMAAAYPPLSINIDRQCTDDPHLRAIYEIAAAQRRDSGVLSNSILLGFPYADVPEMGAATVVVTNDDPMQATRLSKALADSLWNAREHMCGQLVSIDEALEACARADARSRICLLDMGDNVGGGSAGDGTTLVSELLRRRLGPSFACLYDPETVNNCDRVGNGATLRARIGGKTDSTHGPSLELGIEVISLQHGRFTEDQPRHGGIVAFDQGRTAIVKSLHADLTLMLTSRRTAPFSLQQLIARGLDPRQFRILVAKGVNAPLAAYREVCDTFIRVNTIGATCADLSRIEYQHRRRPLYPFEETS